MLDSQAVDAAFCLLGFLLSAWIGWGDAVARCPIPRWICRAATVVWFASLLWSVYCWGYVRGTAAMARPIERTAGMDPERLMP